MTGRSAMLKFFRNYFFVLLGNGTASVLSFAISIFLSRSMSLEGFGAYSLFFTILVLVWQIPAFIDSSFVRYARAGEAGEAILYLRINLVFKLRSAGLILVLAPLAGWSLSRWVVPGKAGWALLALAAAGGAFLTFLTSLTADFQVRENFAAYAAGNIVYYLGVLAALALLARQGSLSTTAVAAAFLSPAAVVGAGALLLLARRARPLLPLSREAADRMRFLGRWILPFFVLWVILQRLDMLIVGHYFSKADLGIYAVATRFLSALGIFVNAAGSLYLTKSALAPTSRRALRLYGREALLLTALISAAVAGLILLAPRLITLFFGARFAAAVPPLRLLLLGSLPQILALPLTYLLYGLEDSFSNFAGMALCLAVNLAVNLTVTPKIGLIGPGWALGAGYSAYFGYLAFSVFFRRRHRVRLAALV